MFYGSQGQYVPLGLNIDFLSQNVQHLNHLLILKNSYLCDFWKGKNIFLQKEVERNLLYPYLLLAGGKKKHVILVWLIHQGF